jgi:hypothetical protein
MITADALTNATWGLVVATALLVLAAAIPAGAALMEHLHARKQRVAMLIPDMHFLRSRFNGMAQEIDNAFLPDEEWVAAVLDRNETDHDMVNRLADIAPKEGLALTSEFYVCRHLLTQARYSLQRAELASEEEPPDRATADAALRRARNLYVAARATIDAAEELFPKRRGHISGEPFWDRYSRQATEREQAAEHQYMRARGA